MLSVNPPLPSGKGQGEQALPGVFEIANTIFVRWEETMRIGALLVCVVALASSPLRGDEPTRMTPTVRLIQKVKPAIAAVFADLGNGGLASGSGAVIHEDGYILTADHVVRDRPGLVLLQDSAPRRYRTVGRLPEKDLAVLKVDTQGPLPRLPLGRSQDLMAGEPILVAGNAGGRGIIFSSGIVSSPSMIVGVNALVMAHYSSDTRDRFIHFDAASNRGNSGGPLINVDGRQIGVVCGKYLAEENMNYAVPVARVRRLFGTIVAAQERRGFWVGIELDATADRAMVSSIQAGSEADKAGLHVGDVIVQVNGKAVRDAVDWHLLLLDRSPAEQMELVYQRADALKTVALRLAEYPLDPPVAKSGKVPGLQFKTYWGRYNAMPDFSKLSPVNRGTIDQFHASRVVGRRDDYALVFEGYVEIAKPGLYRLSILSDDGSRLFLHNRLVLDNDGPHPPQEVSRLVRLAEGLHPVRVEYCQGNGERELQVFLEGEGLQRQAIAPSLLFRDDSGKPATAATPR